MKVTLNRIHLPLIVIAVSLFFVQCSGDKVNFILKQIATEENKVAPIELDEVTTFDSCQALPNKTLRYNYTLASEQSFQKEEIPMFALFQKKQLISDIEQNPSTYKTLIDLNTIIQYAYFDKRGNEIAIITVTPEMYNSKPDRQSDEYVYNGIKEIVEAYTPQLPQIDERENFTEIKVSYPKTVVYNLERINFMKPSSFDSIAYKAEEKVTRIKNIKNNLFTEQFPDANISYHYIFYDQNRQYLCTLDISPEDYK